MTDATSKWFSPFDSQRRIGSVIEVQAANIKINLTLAGQGKSLYVYGQSLRVGELNEYVFLDVGAATILGKLTKVWLEGAERLSVDQLSDKPSENHPVGYVQPLVIVGAHTGIVERGISQYPRLGAQVYAAHPVLVAQILTNKSGNENPLDLALGHLPNNASTQIHASPEQLFARHCAVLGSTGSGKSNTVAKLLELIGEYPQAKVVLIDATGEYKKLHACETYYVGANSEATDEKQLTFPYWELSDSDLYALLRPSGQTQQPKLQAAIESLQVQKNLGKTGAYLKAGQLKRPFFDALEAIKNEEQTNNPVVVLWDFKFLAKQINNECVWANGKDKGNTAGTSIWGDENGNDLLYCSSLIGRVAQLAKNPYMKWLIVDPATNNPTNTVKSQLKKFIESETESGILRLDVSAVPFESNAREILVNAIGRCLLDFCRGDEAIINSHTTPLLVFIDEAHQFLNKSVGEENSRFSLDAFGNIAKEGRKYGLNVVIATQRPRDIPEDVLSQIGTFLVHRLTNPYDQELVKKSIGDLDAATANALPTLATGEALLLGVDFNFAMRLKIEQATNQPQSESVSYSKIWKQSKTS
jgi:hypothetical protein